MEIKDALKSELGRQLKEFLLIEFNKANFITSVEEKDDIEAQAIEIKAQLRTVERLRNVLKKIMSVEEIEKFDKEKDQFFNF